MEKFTDSKLVEQAKAGNDSAFESLYAKYYKLAYYFAYKLCKNDADAKDVVQDAFIEIHRSLSSLKENSYFRAWMYKIVVSKCNKLFHKNRHMTTDFDNEALLCNVQEERKDFLPEYQSHFQNDQEILQACIDQLPLGQKEIILLFYMEQMSLKEIASIMDLPVGTVKSRLSYARTYLKDRLQAYQKHHGDTLTFRQLDVCMASMLHTAVGTTIPLKHSGIRNVSSMVKHAGVFTKVAVISVVSVGACAGTAIVHSLVSSQKIQNELPVETRKNQQPTEFTTVSFEDKIIASPQDAYFTLMSWACCKEMLDSKTVAEVKQREQIYEALKNYGGGFYEALQKSNWSTAFEAICK